MGLITRAMAKKLAAANTDSPGSGVVTTEQVQPRAVVNEKGTAVNADMERDVNGNCVPPNGKDTETNEVLNHKIRIESGPSHTRPHRPIVPGSETIRRRGKNATRAIKPRRVTQATEKKGGSSRGTPTPDVSGKILPDHGPSETGMYNADPSHGASENTSTLGRKRAREETSDADLQMSDVVSKRAKTRRTRRNIGRSAPVGEAPSVARNLRDSTNAIPRVEETNDDLILPATQHDAEQVHDEMPILNSVSDPIAVCSGRSQKEKENSSAARLMSSPEQRSRPKGTCSQTDFVLARTLLTLSKPRIPSELHNDPGSSGKRNEAGFSHRNPSESFASIERHDGATAPSLPDVHAGVVEAETAPVWKARELDPDDFAFLVRRATPCRFEESNVRSEPIIRPAQEE
ncbi:hypothetical protein ACEPAG_2646 [Sanghuangporus baumii]